MSQHVDWKSISPELFEAICSTLVSLLHPETRRIDSLGSDDGRDIAFARLGAQAVFQVKHIPGRLDKLRKRQIAAAIGKAADNSPASWSLITTIEPTPEVMDWFSSLAERYPFQLSWHGPAWLDAQLTSHPAVYHYFFGNSLAEFQRVFRTIITESRSFAHGESGASEKLNAVANQLNDLDPYYAFGISTDQNSGVSLTAWPKYPSAQYDRYEDIESTIRGLTSAVTEGETTTEPPHLGIISTSSPAPSKRITVFLPNKPAGLVDQLALSFSRLHALPDHFHCSVRIVDELGRIRVGLPFEGHFRQRTNNSFEITLKDSTEGVGLTINIDSVKETITLQCNYSTPKLLLAGALLPSLRFLNDYRSPNSVAIWMENELLIPTIPIDEAISEDTGRLLSLVSAVDDVQQATGVYFVLPERFEPDEARDLYMAQQLLAGRTVNTKWSKLSITSTAGALTSLAGSIMHGSSQLLSDGEMMLRVAGNDIPIGIVRRLMANARVTKWPDLDSDIAPDTPVRIEFEAGTDNTMTLSLLEKPATEQ
ncbi:hypothetical protein [Nonomuraea rhizosphaerae]|uniref:hypothetical protein n=1 Tax=Nonomuraea rhizosphaerae TaxID=2665663 RepID=UPI001C5EEF26|nr:hypothetical protein [Nonomuraea rhizosphaerae]